MKKKQISKVTLRDVAKAAAVSPMTVSNFINGKFSSMRAVTKMKVQREIERLGYKPDSIARGLRRSERLSIGFMVVEEERLFLADPFITRIVAGLSNYLSEQGYGLYLQGLTPQNIRDSPLVRNIRTDGICAMLSGSPKTRHACIDALLELKQPLVLFEEVLRTPKDDVCLVRQNDRNGAYQIGKEIISKGARRLMMVIPKLSWPSVEQRVRGIRDAIAQSNNQIDLNIIKCIDVDFELTQASIAEGIKTFGVPDAIIGATDKIAFAAIRYLEKLDMKTPEDVVVSGFHSFDSWQHTDRILTSAQSPAYEIGIAGGKAILNRLVTGHFESQDIVLPLTVHFGNTT